MDLWMNEMDKAEVLLISTSVFENKQMSCWYYKKRERECYRIKKRKEKRETNDCVLCEWWHFWRAY